LQNSTKAYKNSISLPIFNNMSLKMVNKVSKCILQYSKN